MIFKALSLATLGLIITVFISTQAQATVFMADKLESFVPTETFSMDPGALDRRLILKKNSLGIGGVMAISFAEETNYFGFSALICDEENAKLYESGKSASCTRKVINKASDRLLLKFDGRHDYYLFIINKTTPIRVTRNITAFGKVYVASEKKVKEIVEGYVAELNIQLKALFDLEPLNIAVIPCEKKYIPSSFENKTLTVCSEFILNSGAVPDQDLFAATVSYELVPFLQKIWRADGSDSEDTRIEFAAMITMTLTKSLDAFKNYVDLLEKNQVLEKITIQYPNQDTSFSYLERVNSLIRIFNAPFVNMDKWLHIAYENMTQTALEEIRDGKYRHYGFHMNTARLVLKRRYEQQLRAENPEEKEENIISDFW